MTFGVHERRYQYRCSTRVFFRELCPNQIRDDWVRRVPVPSSLAPPGPCATPLLVRTRRMRLMAREAEMNNLDLDEVPRAELELLVRAWRSMAHPVPVQMWARARPSRSDVPGRALLAQSWRRCGRAAQSQCRCGHGCALVLVQMWQDVPSCGADAGRSAPQLRCRCGQGGVPESSTIL